MKETYKFQAEINQLMSLIINAFYSNKDIFLRELISNSSDALDKIRHFGLSNKEALENEPELYIHIRVDKDAKTISIVDTGVGMTKEELKNNLGTIARSGTKNFMETLSEGKGDMSLIGQFGVGFYSAYLVADNVKVTTKHNDSDAVLVWESNAGGSFTISEISEENFEVKRGTKIDLHIKDDLAEYLNDQKMQEIVKKHSAYTNYPISYWKTITEEKEVPDDVEETDSPEIEGEVEESSEEKKPKMKKIKESRNEWSLINNQKPIWTRKPDDVTKEEYEAFYKSLTNDWNTCEKWSHFQVEGQLEFTGLLYVPKQAPMEMFEKTKKLTNIKLYVRRVFITDDCTDLIPEYLNFVKGLVDSEDLPLNVSREILQQNKIIKVIKKNLIKKCIEMFDTLSEDKEAYKTFYDNYSKNLKLGVHEDSTNRTKLMNLMRYKSAKKDFISLEDYCSNMPEGQKSIYFITGESVDTVQNSPFVEAVKKKGYDVLFMTDAIDEYAVQQMKEYTYEDKQLKLLNITKEGMDIEPVNEEDVSSFKKTCEYIKETLGDLVEKVSLSNRITDSPCVLVTGEYGWSANMERIMKAQALGNNQSMSYMSGKKSMELSKDHNIIKEIKRRVDETNTEKTTKDLVLLMFEGALLASGFGLKDPQQFNKRIINMIQLGLSLDDPDDDPATEPAEPASDDPAQIEEIEESKMEEVD
jgi:molecular chaperone HtpG